MNLIQSERLRRLQGLVSAGDVDMNWSAEVMERQAPFVRMPVSENRIRGMLIGLATTHLATQPKVSYRAFAWNVMAKFVTICRTGMPVIVALVFHLTIRSLHSGCSSI
jgi:hypothetical protein